MISNNYKEEYIFRVNDAVKQNNITEARDIRKWFEEYYCDHLEYRPKFGDNWGFRSDVFNILKNIHDQLELETVELFLPRLNLDHSYTSDSAAYWYSDDRQSFIFDRNKSYGFLEVERINFKYLDEFIAKVYVKAIKRCLSFNSSIILKYYDTSEVLTKALSIQESFKKNYNDSSFYLVTAYHDIEKLINKYKNHEYSDYENE